MVSFHGFVQKLILKDANTVSSLPKAPTLTVHTQIHTYTAQFHESLHKHAYTHMGPRVPAHCSVLFFSSKPLLSWVLWSSLALGDSQSHSSVSSLTLGSPPKTAPLQIAKRALCVSLRSSPSQDQALHCPYCSQAQGFGSSSRTQ